METKKTAEEEKQEILEQVEANIQRMKQLMLDYAAAKKKNPSLHIPFFENHTAESQTKSE
ncbi:MAG: hypothetical protein WCO02_09975 [Bacteroidota bacterium]